MSPAKASFGDYGGARPARAARDAADAPRGNPARSSSGPRPLHLVAYPNGPDLRDAIAGAAQLSQPPSVRAVPGEPYATVVVDRACERELFAKNGSLILSSGEAVLFAHSPQAPPRPLPGACTPAGRLDLCDLDARDIAVHSFVLLKHALQARQQGIAVAEVVYAQDASALVVAHWQDCCLAAFFPRLRRLAFALRRPLLGCAALVLAPPAGCATVDEVFAFLAAPGAEWARVYAPDAVLGITAAGRADEAAAGPEEIARLHARWFPAGFQIRAPGATDLVRSDTALAVVVGGATESGAFVRSVLFHSAAPPFLIQNDHVLLYG
jgi:hypothetical protein